MELPRFSFSISDYEYINRVSQFDSFYYDKEGGLPLGQILKTVHEELVATQGWEMDIIALQMVRHHELFVPAPIVGFRNFELGENVEKVVIEGIHAGTEGAPYEAIRHYTPQFAALAVDKKTLFVLANSYGYMTHTRYGTSNKSVGDCDQFQTFSSAHPASYEADALTQYFGEILEDSTPLILDCHEDRPNDGHATKHDSPYGTYIYVLGKRPYTHPLVMDILSLLRNNDVPLVIDDTTGFGEPIKGGVVAGIRDGSLDQRLYEQFLLNKCDDPLVITLETPTMSSLAHRAYIHWKATELFLRYKP